MSFKQNNKNISSKANFSPSNIKQKIMRFKNSRLYNSQNSGSHFVAIGWILGI